MIELLFRERWVRGLKPSLDSADFSLDSADSSLDSADASLDSADSSDPSLEGTV